MIAFLKQYWAVFNPELMPADYRPDGKLGPKHVDWIKGLRWVPRAWTMFWFPLPAVQIAGNAPMKRFPVKPGYPIAEGAVIEKTPEGEFFYGPDPVLERGQWSLQGVKFPGKPPIPCYFTATIPWFNGMNRLISFILKPDPSDPNWGFPEISFRSKLVGGAPV